MNRRVCHTLQPSTGVAMHRAKPYPMGPGRAHAPASVVVPACGNCEARPAWLARLRVSCRPGINPACVRRGPSGVLSCDGLMGLYTGGWTASKMGWAQTGVFCILSCRILKTQLSLSFHIPCALHICPTLTHSYSNTNKTRSPLWSWAVMDTKPSYDELDPFYTRPPSPPPPPPPEEDKK